MIYNYY